jgi:hypothetical protein
MLGAPDLLQSSAQIRMIGSTPGQERNEQDLREWSITLRAAVALSPLPCALTWEEDHPTAL